MAETLSVAEQARLDQLNAELRDYKRSFIKAGLALKEVRESRLYRATHATFEAYCLEVYGWDKAHVNRMIREAEVGQDLEQNCSIELETPSQARALAKVAPGHRGEVLEEAHATAPVGKNGRPKVTAKHVAQTAARMTPEAGESVAVDDEPPAEPNEIGEGIEAIDDFLDRQFSGKPAHVRAHWVNHIRERLDEL